MSDRERYDRALEYARAKHKGQYRIGGDEYITHPIAAAELLANAGYGTDYQIAALFHDLLEDTDAEESELLALGSEEILAAVRLLTKTPGCDPAEYTARIRENPMALAVKTADRLHNLKSAVKADDAFKRKYIRETEEWYADLSPEIPKALSALRATLGQKEENR